MEHKEVLGVRVARVKQLINELKEYDIELTEQINIKEDEVRMLLINLLEFNHVNRHRESRSAPTAKTAAVDNTDKKAYLNKNYKTYSNNNSNNSCNSDCNNFTLENSNINCSKANQMLPLSMKRVVSSTSKLSQIEADQETNYSNNVVKGNMKRVRFSSKSPQITIYSTEREPTVSPICSTNVNNTVNKSATFDNNGNNITAGNVITTSESLPNCAKVDCTNYVKMKSSVTNKRSERHNALEVSKSLSSIREYVTSARHASPRSSVSVYLNCMAQMRDCLQSCTKNTPTLPVGKANELCRASSTSESLDMDEETNAGTPTLPFASISPTPEPTSVTKLSKVELESNINEMVAAGLLPSVVNDVSDEENCSSKQDERITNKQHNPLSEYCEETYNNMKSKIIEANIEHVQSEELSNHNESQDSKIINHFNADAEYYACNNRHLEGIEKQEEVSKESVNNLLASPPIWLVRHRRHKFVPASSHTLCVENTYEKRISESNKVKFNANCEHKTMQTNHESQKTRQKVINADLQENTMLLSQKVITTTRQRKRNISQSTHKLQSYHFTCVAENDIELACGPTLYFD